MRSRKARRRRKRIDPINMIGMIVVAVVIVFAISTLIRAYRANAEAEQVIADTDEWFEKYERGREEHEARMQALEQQKLAEYYGGLQD